MMLPAPLAQLWNAWNELRASETAPLSLVLVGPSGLCREQVRRWLAERSPYPSGLVLGSEADPLPRGDVYLLAMPTGSTIDPDLVVALRREARDHLMVALLGPSPVALAQRQKVAETLELGMDRVVQADDLDALATRLSSRLVGQFAEYRVRLGRQFLPLRAEAASREIQATAQQNALVGAMPVPGADLPVMTANQVKLVLRLATLHDQHLGPERLAEVLATLGGGVALRAAARQLAKFVPGPGWLLAGAMGYSGTLAIGKAAQAYFQREQKPPSAPGGAIEAEARVVST